MLLTAVDLSAEIFQMNSIIDKHPLNAAFLSGRPVPAPAGCWFLVFRREPKVKSGEVREEEAKGAMDWVTFTTLNGPERREGGKGGGGGGSSNEGGGEGSVQEERRKGHY